MTQSKTPVLAVDLDGVVGDYIAAFREVVAAETGVPVESLGPAHSWFFAECWPTAVRDIDHFFELHRLAVVKHRLFRHMPVVEGASEALWRISDAGVHIRIVTHRLCINGHHALAAADTVEWMDEGQRIPYRDLCFTGNKAEVGADMYIDDAPQHIAALEAAGAAVVAFAHPFNEGMGRWRTNDWSEIADIVLRELVTPAVNAA